MFEIGNTLRETRLRRQLDIAECERRTRIRAKYLRALEDEEFDVMPAPTFARGFLKTYAEFLGLDGNLILDEYDSRYLERESPPETRARGSRGPGLGAALPREARPSRHRPRRGRSGPGRRRGAEGQLVAAAATALLSVSVIIWAGFSNGGGGPGPSPLPPTGAGRTSASPPGLAPPRTPARLLRVAVTGRSPAGSYLQVRARDRAGRTVYQGVLGPGQRRSWSVRHGLWISVARADGIRLTVDGAVKPLAPGTASYEITRTGLRVTSASG